MSLLVIASLLLLVVVLPFAVWCQSSSELAASPSFNLNHLISPAQMPSAEDLRQSLAAIVGVSDNRSLSALLHEVHANFTSLNSTALRESRQTMMMPMMNGGAFGGLGGLGALSLLNGGGGLFGGNGNGNGGDGGSASPHSNLLPIAILLLLGLALIAYPELKYEREPWKWLQLFFDSINPPTTSPKATQNAMELLVDELNFDSLQIVSIRLPETKPSLLELDFLRQNSNVDIIDHPRQAWTDKSPPAVHVKARLSQTKLCALLRHVDILFLNFLYLDYYEIRQILACTATVKHLVTHLTLEPEAHTRDQNYALEIYDLYQSMFFTHFLAPKVADWTECQGKPDNCKSWILWTRTFAAVIPPAADGSAEMELQRIRSFINNPQKETCRIYQEIGGKRTKAGFMDGTKAVCLDELDIKKECLVYSFGISEDWTFDDAMHASGCQVYSFDPSIGLEAQQRGASHWFYPWGLKAEKTPAEWTVYTLHEIRRKMGHEKKRISILKMDVEGAEWSFLEDVELEQSLQGVDQILMEMHLNITVFGAHAFRQRASLLFRLERIGFVLFFSRKNPLGQDARVRLQSRKDTHHKMIGYELSFRRVAGCTPNKN